MKGTQDNSLFHGHRERMRRKLKSFGTDVFESYELLEMLLYHVIKIRDTHPTAKLLIAECGSLSSVFSSDADRLMKIEGVGERTAGFLAAVGSFANSDNFALAYTPSPVCTHEEILKLFIEHFKGSTSAAVSLLLLDNSLRAISLVPISESELSSGKITPSPFIDAAIAGNASVAVLGSCRPYGAGIASEGDRESFKLLERAFSGIGITLADCYTVSGQSCSPLTEAFKKRAGAADGKPDSESCDRICKNELSAFLLPVLKYTERDHLKLAELISEKFGTKSSLFRRDDKEIEHACASRSAAELIVLISALSSRMKTEKFRFGKQHSEMEIKHYLCALYINIPREAFYMLSLDSSGKVLASDRLTGGAVNSVSLSPRAIIERAKEAGADEIILAHNHPGGSTLPSSDDIEATRELSLLLSEAGLKLSAHYIVSDGECRKIDFSPL